MKDKEPVDILNSRPAMLRAMRRACQLAIMYKHPIAISRGGKVVNVPPEEILAELDKAEKEETKTTEKN